MAYEGHFQNIATRDIVAEQERYEWPSGFARLLKLELVRTDGSTIPIIRYERNYEPNQSQGASGDGYHPLWRPVSGGFLLEPKPQSSVTGGLRMEFNGIPAELDDTADELHADFPEMFDELIVLDTVVGLFHSEELQELGLQRTFNTWHAKWEERWNSYIMDRLQSTQRVIPWIPSYRDA